MSGGKLREDWLIDPSCKVLQNPDHFCFNSDTAALAQFVQVRKGDRVLEIGTNNAAILLYLDRYQPAFLCGIEIIEPAAKLARENLKRSADSGWKIIQGSVFETEPEIFDVVLCNPPYFDHDSLDEAVSRDLRHQARFEYDLDLAGMIEQASKRLSSNGRFCFVHRPQCLNKAIMELEKNGLHLSRLQICYDVRDEQAKAILAEAIKDVRRDVIIEKPYWYGKR